MLNIEESKEGHTEIYQDASVYIPVEVTSRADSGEIKTSCFGEPTVAFHEDRRNGKYCFTIMQPICVEIPIEVSAEALLGKLYIKCGDETDSSFEPDCEEKDTDFGADCEEKDTDFGADCEEKKTGRETVFEETSGVSSPEPEPPKPSPSPSSNKYWYKVYF